MSKIRQINGHRVIVTHNENDATVFIGGTSMRRYNGFLSPHALVAVVQKLGAPHRIHENTDGAVYTLEYDMEVYSLREQS